MNLRSDHIGSLYVGPYVDKPGAVMSIGDQVVHLSEQQCLQLAQRLTGCARCDIRPNVIPADVTPSSTDLPKEAS